MEYIPASHDIGGSQVAQWWRIWLPMPEMQEMQVRSLGLEDPWRRKWQATPVFLPGKFYGQESGGLQSIALQRVGHLSTHAFLPQDERGYMWMEIWTGFIMSCCWMRYLVYRAELRARDRERDCPEGKIKQHRVRSQREPCFPCYATWRRCGWTNYWSLSPPFSQGLWDLGIKQR